MAKTLPDEKALPPETGGGATPRRLALLSVVTTADPRAGLLDELVAALDAFAVAADHAVELIVVDDLGVNPAACSGQMTAKLSIRCLPGHPQGGQERAILEGIRDARGDVVVCMDPDMHRNVAGIGLLLAAWGEGKDLVYVWRRARRDTVLWRRLASWLNNGLHRLLFRTGLHDINTPMFLLSREAVAYLFTITDDIHALKLRMHARFRASFSEIPLRVQPAGIGGSNYSFSLLARLFLVRLLAAFRLR